MKYLTVILIFIGLNANAQINGDWINPGGMNLRINSDGELATFNQNAASEAKSGSNNHFFKFINLWISGYDNNNQLHISSVNGYSHKTDFSAGPIDSLTYIGLDPKDWDYVWSVNRPEIKAHRENFRNANYIPTDAIKNWPANKTGRFNPYLAPFIDYDANGIYEPEKGDYPDFPGQNASYFIINDNYAEHKASGGQPLKIEIYGMLYTSVYSSNTVYGKYYIVNRTDKDFSNINLSLHAGIQLGNSLDNYCGTLVNKNIIFAYNGDANDEGHFGTKKPVCSIMFLNANLSSSIYLSNNNDSESGLPLTPAEHRNFMEGKWKSGKQLTYGENGMNTGNNASFIYPENSDPKFTGNTWVESSTPSERSVLGNLKYATLNSKKYLELDFAISAFDSSLGNPYQFLENASQKIKTDWMNQTLSKGNQMITQEIRIKNPIVSGEPIIHEDFNKFNRIEIINQLGQIVKTVNPKVENRLIISEPGIYYLILNSDNQHITKKIIII
jgi:hypothetical protein